MQESLPSFETILFDRFGALAPLEDGDRAFLTRIVGRARDNHRVDARLWSDQNPSRAPSLIVSGWACSARGLASGARQIIEILLPGDVIGLGPGPRLLSSATVSALTPLRTVATPELAQVWREQLRTPRMAERLEALLAEQHFLLTGHIVRLGRASAHGRVANLLSELHWRLGQRGLATGDVFPMPLTQEQIADAVGLSVVHVNRTLQQLRREELIFQERGQVRLLDAPGVYAAGEFTPPRSGET